MTIISGYALQFPHYAHIRKMLPVWVKKKVFFTTMKFTFKCYENEIEQYVGGMIFWRFLRPKFFKFQSLESHLAGPAKIATGCSSPYAVKPFVDQTNVQSAECGRNGHESNILAMVLRGIVPIVERLVDHVGGPCRTGILSGALEMVSWCVAGASLLKMVTSGGRHIYCI